LSRITSYGRLTIFILILIGAAANPVWSQIRSRLSIATGATGGVYYPLGVGMARLVSKHFPGEEATVEVTSGSVDNMKLIHTRKAALAFTLPDTAWDAYRGQLKGLNEKVAVRSLLALYSNYMHVVTLEGSGIRSVADLKGKRVSTGAPGSGTEVKGLRVMEAYGLTAKDLKSRERLGIAESAEALKERKIDAFLWDGGLPTAAIAELAAAPGVKVNFISHGDAVARMVSKYGPLYFSGPIPRWVYKGIEKEVPVAAATNLLAVHERMDDSLAYQLTKLFLEHTADLVAAHKAAGEITLKSAVMGSPIPFHPGALRYFKEKGVKVPATMP